ncbi:MAG: tRNA glutamyl-Q(34) synthetase GluQRS [Moraxellaceae bacterium]|nr:tRNA glutamyl-Q(34) synthetase GluQRS [Moraxellaceae bacterium]MBP8852570.1 tRNA glutamyl-Q(34) synthetase GluQRS [Moraxellaceae bacterium]MBP9044907.1 tRNA glutamyl-Q(34) synthetase GluQRS [Moraxellaceae bacterium]MBP9730242.1 tRNA glutamyl-Q(34) synthetase GluQRS [Moraxellaceae bacterium]
MRATIGRFAPSPTGPLHAGSLLAAVASYCEARAAGGQWLVRIEDLDPPREVPGASSLILHQLEAFGFEWDGEVRYQSRRQDDYEAALTALQKQGLLFWCRCSRTDLARLPSPAYPGTCREFTLPRPDAAIRLRVSDSIRCFTDALFGSQQESVRNTVGDFVLKRRDGLYAYQLAVVVDDADQGITQVVRGSDLLDNTARQIVLQQMLGVPTPDYMHLPLIVNTDGNKLSKQTFAKALPLTGCTTLLLQTLHHLRQKPPARLQAEQPSTVLAWAVANWQRHRIGTDPIPFSEGC